ncbi:MAG: MCE family protein [Acetobacteraceae bacterium]|nr:MCE family protein [Acetobacteraceae bacterium]
MTGASEPSRLAAASLRRSRRVSAIWIIPLVAVVIAAWLAWDTLSREGPTITISFESAEGLQAGQSQLKYKELTLGTVRSLALSRDRSRVVATVATTSQARPLLTEDTRFWVVKPRLFAGNLSGFETLLSGSYIGMLPGKSGTARRTFTGQENPPVLTSAVAGHTFLLEAHRLGSVTLGAPIFYRDLDVGEVLGWDIGDMARTATIHAFVRAPFDQYVHQNTRFWNASGLDVRLSGSGVDLQVQSLRALLLGGIAFATPETGPPGPQSAENAVFPLFPNSQAAAAASYTREISFVAYFPGSVRGLAKGADVTLHGLKVGEVTDVSLDYDPAKNAVTAPVRFLVQPERVVGIGKQVRKDTTAAVDELVRQGLRASLASANLLTGQMLVALTFVPDAQPASLAREGDAFVMPTTDAGSFSGLEASLSELLRKVNAVPLDKIGANLDQMTRGADELVNGPQLKQVLESLTELLATTQNTVHQLDAGVAPAARQLPELTTSLRKMIAQTSNLLVSLDSTYGAKTRFSTELDRSLTQLNDSLRSIQALADLLSRHPEALIRGRAGGVE